MNENVTEVVSQDGFEDLILKIFKLDEEKRSDLLPINEQKISSLKKILSALKPKEEQVIKLRFGINEKKRHALAEVDQIMNLSRGRILQLQENALRKLRLASRIEQLKYVFNEAGRTIGYNIFFKSEIEKTISEQQIALRSFEAENAKLRGQKLILLKKLQAAISIIKKNALLKERIKEVGGDLAALNEDLSGLISLLESFEQIKRTWKSNLNRVGDRFQVIEGLLRLDDTPVLDALNQDNFDELLLHSNFNVNIEELRLSTRSILCLKGEGIKTLGELAQKSELDLMRVRNLGRKSLNEIKELLSDYNLRLGMNYPWDFIAKD